MFKTATPDISALLRAIEGGADAHVFARCLEPAHWQVLAPFLHVEELQRGDILTAQGALDRSLYFLESGTLRVHYATAPDAHAVASVKPGSVVGEGAFFSELERNATVQASTACRVWRLAPEGFAQVAKNHSVVALALALALGATLATRMLDVSKRVAIT